MELKECITCGSHTFTDNKCDYCGNQYKTTEIYEDDNQVKLVYGNAYSNTYYDEKIENYVKDLREYPNRTESYAEKFNGLEITEIDFQETPEGKKLLKVMIFILISIVWFAVCVFIPPLFIITIFGLIILPVIKKLKK